MLARPSRVAATEQTAALQLERARRAPRRPHAADMALLRSMSSQCASPRQLAAVQVSHFGWEAVADATGVWQHTEYLIELRLGIDGTAAASAAPDEAPAAPPAAPGTVRGVEFFRSSDVAAHPLA